MRYPGGKGKCYPHLINLMPPHQTYIESHLGSGAVMWHKLPAQRQIGIDIDPRVIATWKKLPGVPCELVCTDAVEYLDSVTIDSHTLIYADPPYVPETRRRNRVYRYDYTNEDHESLIRCLRRKDCLVMISGYNSDLYRSLLAGWTQITFLAKTHVETCQESVWLNFDPPMHLHDTNYLGQGFREREVFRRRRSRLQSRIEQMCLTEQYGLLEWLQNRLKEN